MGVIQGTNGNWTCGKREYLLFGLDGIRQWGGENRFREKRGFLERVSNSSLNFPVIGQSNLGEPRGKVAPHGKSYAWIPVLGSFNNSGR